MTPEEEQVLKVAEHGKELERHSKALNRIGESLDSLTRETHEIRITLRERDETTRFLKTSFNAILLGILMQLAGTIWWAAKLDSAVETLSANISDHESRLRKGEQQQQPAINHR